MICLMETNRISPRHELHLYTRTFVCHRPTLVSEGLAATMPHKCGGLSAREEQANDNEMM